MANIADKMIVKEMLMTVRNSRANDVLPATSRILLERYLDDDIEQLEAEIALDMIKLMGAKKDE